MSLNERDEFVFTWKIENFSFCYQIDEECLNSPKFKIECLNNSEWQLQLYPRERDEEGPEFIRCFLYQEDFLPCRVPFEAKIEVVGTDVKFLKMVEDHYDPTNKDQEELGAYMVLAQQTKVNVEDILTIRCHFYGNVSENKSFAENMARTKINVHRLVFEMELLGSFDEDYQIKKVRDEANQEKFTLPGGNSFECVISGSLDDLDVSITKTKSGYEKCHFVECKLILRGIDESDKYIEKATHFFHSDNLPEVWTFPAENISKLATGRNCWFDVDYFYIIRFRWELTCSSGSEIHEFIGPESCPTLQEGLRGILQNKTFNDIELRVNNQSVNAHKNILSARSPVFSALFQQNTTEDHVNIADTDFDTLKLFLEYLYTDTVDEMDYDKARNLLEVADKYQVLSLKKKCLGFLKSEISVKNACEVLGLADSFSDTHLKSTVIDFIVAYSDAITSSPEWTLWMERNAELASEVSKKITPIDWSNIDNISIKTITLDDMNKLFEKI